MPSNQSGERETERETERERERETEGERNFEHKKNPDDSDECRGLKGLNDFSFSLRVVVLTLLEYVSSKFL